MLGLLHVQGGQADKVLHKHFVQVVDLAMGKN